MPKLSEFAISRIIVPAGKREVIVWDDSLRGFGVRKFASGRASYFVKYRVGVKQRKLTLGTATPGMLDKMRLTAAEVLAKARLGQDVANEKKAALAAKVATVGELVPRYLKSREGEVVAEYHYQLNLFLHRYWRPLHKLEIDAVTRRQIVMHLDRIAEKHGKVGADRAKAALSGFFAWAIERGYVDLSPVQGIRKRATNGPRDRVLTEAELAAIWQASGEWDYGRILRLLILTGQRASEISDLEWSEINFERCQIELPGSRTKNKRSHIVPLSEQALAILRSLPRQNQRNFLFGYGQRGFQGWSKSKKQLDVQARRQMNPELMESFATLTADLKDEETAASKLGFRSVGDLLCTIMPPFTVHDIRRSVSTHINENDFAQPHVVEAILNHISGSKASIAGIYNRATYAKEKRQSLDVWGAYIEAKVDGRADKVIVSKR